MGDRAMAEIKTRGGDLYFYTHWCGYILPKIAREALKEAQPRISDDAYALKIVVDALIEGSDARDKETGAGLMFEALYEDEYNNDSPSVVIDLVRNKVEVKGSHAPSQL